MSKKKIKELKVEEFLDEVVTSLHRSLIVTDISDEGSLYTVRVKTKTGQVFLVRVGVEP